MPEFGAIVLTRFPFTDLSGSKLRPALVISHDNNRREDVVLAFITSNAAMSDNPDAMPLAPSHANGLKTQSFVRFDKIVTLEKRVLVGELGQADAAFLAVAGPVFFGVFGFANSDPMR